jgi:hypothetical protein
LDARLGFEDRKRRPWGSQRETSTTAARSTCTYAIGAKIQIKFAEQESTEWVIAGDGYLSRNEAVVSFGLGGTAEVDQLLITWPAGNQQLIPKVAADQRLLIVEDQPAPFRLD